MSELRLRIGEEQHARMKVGSQIVEHLSKGLYDDPAKAIRELISNSFDAEALKVIIRAKPELDRFSITDDGNGMNYEDFDNNFLFISRSNKRDDNDLTSNLKRPIIGKIGIGFVSASIICDEMIVISSKKGDPHKFEAVIDFSKYRNIEFKKKKIYELSEIQLTNYKEEKDAHYTIIILQKLSKDFYQRLIDKDLKDADIDLVDFNDLKFENIINKINKIADYSHSFDLSKDVGRYWQLLLELANYLPIKYLDDGPIDESLFNDQATLNKMKIINKLKENVKNLNFSVDFDGVELKKPILFPNTEDIQKINEDFDIFPFEYSENNNGNPLKFKGYIYNQKKSIYPPQFRGIIIRIKNTAIGDPDQNFLEYLYAEKLFLNWTFGEIYVEEGLEEAMNINRNGFSIVHPHYTSLRRFLHKKLHDEVFVICRKRYIKRRDESKKYQQGERYKKYKKFLKNAFNLDFDVTISSGYSDTPIKIDSNNNKLIIFDKHPIYKNNKIKPFIEESLLLLEITRLKVKDDAEKMIDSYLKLLSEWYYE